MARRVTQRGVNCLRSGSGQTGSLSSLTVALNSVCVECWCAELGRVGSVRCLRCACAEKVFLRREEKTKGRENSARFYAHRVDNLLWTYWIAIMVPVAMSNNTMPPLPSHTLVGRSMTSF